jgi:hypothetical protein
MHLVQYQAVHDLAHLEPQREWLGYAIFHPDAASCSSLTSLSVSLQPLSDVQLDAFKNMALGNNLAVPDQSSLSTFYHEGHVGAGTKL